MMRNWMAACATFVMLGTPTWAQIEIQEVTSPGGIKAWLVEDQSIPMAALEIRFRGGTSLDAPDKAGATYMMTGLIEEGAGDLSSQDFAQRLEELTAGFSFSANKDSVMISAKFLSENRAEVIDLLTLGLNQPNFANEDLERIRAMVLANIRSNEKSANAIAGQKLASTAFAGHPYAQTRTGTVETVSALTRDDIIAAHKNALSRDHLVVAAAGDLSPEELGQILDQLFGDLPATGAALPGPANWQQEAGLTVIDFPSPQTTVIFAQPGIAQHDPDFFPAFLLNDIIGGDRFTARLMTEVRDKRGLTYGIHTNLIDLDQAAYWAGNFSSSNDKVAEAVDVINQQWQDVAENGITEAELKAAKTYLTGAYPLRFDGNALIASNLAGMQLEGFPIDYTTKRNDLIEAVTIDDVQRVAKKLMEPNSLHFILVGQPENITP